jgi:GntR family transcriptional regulator
MVCIMASDAPVFDKESVTPLYEQVADYLAAQVEAGHLAPGQKLPAERDLADQWNVGYQTIRRAMEVLRERGLVVSRIGKGTFIATHSTESP